MGKECTGEGQFIWVSYYTAFLQPFEEGGRTSSASYLPFPVVYPEFATKKSGRDRDRFTYIFDDLDGLLGPVAILRFPESITEDDNSFGFSEPADMFASQKKVPAYHAIDFRRFSWPKSNAWTPVSYQSEAIQHSNEVVRVYSVFPTPTTLRELQVEFDLETVSEKNSVGHSVNTALMDADADDDAGDQDDAADAENRMERKAFGAFLRDERVFKIEFTLS